jgi:hypothetical protein
VGHEINKPDKLSRYFSNSNCATPAASADLDEMARPLPYRSDRTLAGQFYVCEIGGPPFARRLAGPFASATEAQAALGAIEAEHAAYQARTEVWLCPSEESDAIPAPCSLAASSAAMINA